MITNLPTHDEFERLAVACLNQAFDIVYKADKYTRHFQEDGVQEKIWAYSQSKLNTAIVLIHQGIEAFMKASICDTSPLLLLEGKRTDWAGPQDKDFNDCYTVPAESLISTFLATSSATINQGLTQHIEEIRVLRNQIIHGLPNRKLNPKSIIEKLLYTHTYFQGKDAWWSSLRAEFLEHPLTEGYDNTVEFAEFAERLDYVQSYIGKTKLSKHFTAAISGRAYKCPQCALAYGSEYETAEYELKWAFLQPNTPTANEVLCLNCNAKSSVVRTDCVNDYEECLGNVIYQGQKTSEIICLTCGNEQAERESE
jgi:hypothetical protein